MYTYTSHTRITYIYIILTKELIYDVMSGRKMNIIPTLQTEILRPDRSINFLK